MRDTNEPDLLERAPHVVAPTEKGLAVVRQALFIPFIYIMEARLAIQS